MGKPGEVRSLREWTSRAPWKIPLRGSRERIGLARSLASIPARANSASAFGILRASVRGACDLRALTPLVWSHVNPFGSFRLDMNSRMSLEAQRRGAGAEAKQLKLYDQEVG
jgi:hypothetical protein